MSTKPLFACHQHSLVLPSVICSYIVAERIADRVPLAVSAPHDHGCAQLGTDNEQTKRTLISTGANPNVADVVVGLGCEEDQSDTVATELHKIDVSTSALSIQDAGGTEACITDGTKYAQDLVDAGASYCRL